MSITVSDPIDAAPDASETAPESATADSFAGQSSLASSLSRSIAFRVRMLLTSCAVWVLYVPHYSVLWLLGPRYGMAWVRVAARVHWLLTFFGTQRNTRQRLEELAPFFTCRESVSQILLKHLELKHECFARVRVYNLHGKSSQRTDIHWQVSPRCLDAVPQAEGRVRGLILVGFHFGSFQMSTTALSQVLPGCNPVQLRFLHAQSADQTASPVARLALRKAMEADKRSGAQIFYVDTNTNVMPMLRLLREGGCIGVAADGMLADEFVEVPFLDGMLRIPSGWARLAALTHAEISVLADKEINRRSRELIFDGQVRCDDRSPESIQAALTEVARILERLICEEPWGWHPWQRLRREVNTDGVPHYFLQQFGTTRDEQVSNRRDSAKSRMSAPALDLPRRRQEKRRPSIAILANSLTPYRIQLHERIVREVPEVELWSLATHGNSYDRWVGAEAPSAIRPANFGRGEPTNEQTLLRYSIREWRKGGRIIRWLKEHKVSAVFCQGCGDIGRMRVLRWCHRNQIPCFLTGDFNVQSDRLRGIKRWAKRQVYERAVAWSVGLMPCGSNGQALFDRYGGSTKPSYDFPFVPDVELFLRPPADAVDTVRTRLGLPTERRRIVFSARMMPAKRPDLALAAFARIADERPDWDLVMLGDGRLRPQLESGVPPQLRSRTIWTGFMHDPREVAALYSVSDLLLLPSDHEPWGVVVVEAAAAGMGIVASSVVGAAPELVRENRNGCTFPASDLNALVEALRTTTAPDQIDNIKRQSRDVLNEWLAVADPVDGIRAALAECNSFNGRQRIAGCAGSTESKSHLATFVTAGELGAALSLFH